eukprot:5856561-Prymnesium_polylepis.1
MGVTDCRCGLRISVQCGLKGERQVFGHTRRTISSTMSNMLIGKRLILGISCATANTTANTS